MDHSKSRYTKFYKIKDADFMIDTVIGCAKRSNVKYNKSKDYFRVEIQYKEGISEIRALVNVIKKPGNEMR